VLITVPRSRITRRTKEEEEEQGQQIIARSRRGGYEELRASPCVRSGMAVLVFQFLEKSLEWGFEGLKGGEGACVCVCGYPFFFVGVFLELWVCGYGWLWT
jgi:hypothetical protein